jgi:hypothetical protein
MVVITSFTSPFLKIFLSIMTIVRLLVKQALIEIKLIDTTGCLF